MSRALCLIYTDLSFLLILSTPLSLLYSFPYVFICHSAPLISSVSLSGKLPMMSLSS